MTVREQVGEFNWTNFHLRMEVEWTKNLALSLGLDASQLDQIYNAWRGRSDRHPLPETDWDLIRMMIRRAARGDKHLPEHFVRDAHEGW